VDFFREQEEILGAINAVGVACFGPVDLNLKSPKYGFVTTTPKLAWRDADVVGTLTRALQLPVGFDTDVNGAAVGEGLWGAGRGLENFIYLTIGTGVGGGAVVNGRPVHGLIHPEMGHMHLAHDWQKDPFAGACPYHGDCLEGMAAGPAMNKRWGQPAETLPADHPAWELEAEYLAQAVSNLVVCFSPQRIILGGGVMQQPQLFSAVRRKTLQLLNGYVQSQEILEHVDEYIVPPGLGNRAGSLGALALAMQAA